MQQALNRENGQKNKNRFAVLRESTRTAKKDGRVAGLGDRLNFSNLSDYLASPSIPVLRPVTAPFFLCGGMCDVRPRLRSESIAAAPKRK